MWRHGRVVLIWWTFDWSFSWEIRGLEVLKPCLCTHSKSIFINWLINMCSCMYIAVFTLASKHVYSTDVKHLCLKLHCSPLVSVSNMFHAWFYNSHHFLENMHKILKFIIISLWQKKKDLAVHSFCGLISLVKPSRYSLPRYRAKWFNMFIVSMQIKTTLWGSFNHAQNIITFRSWFGQCTT